MISYLYSNILHTGFIFYPLCALAFLGWLLIILVLAFIVAEHLLRQYHFSGWRLWLLYFFRGVSRKNLDNFYKKEEICENFFAMLYKVLPENSFLQYVSKSFENSAWRHSESHSKERFVYLVYLHVLAPNFNHIKTVRVIAGIAPLLGLWGTVSGMIDTFRVISLYGNANPALMADGISKALLTTQAGLCIALPLLFLSGYANNRLKKLRDRLNRLLI